LKAGIWNKTRTRRHLSFIFSPRVTDVRCHRLEFFKSANKAKSSTSADVYLYDYTRDEVSEETG